MTRPAWLGFAAGLALLLGAAQVSAQTPESQQQLTQSRLRLEQMRADRARLQSELDVARTGVQSTSEELANIERQLSAARSVVAELELQLEITQEESVDNSRILLLTREQHLESTAVLNRRLRDVYKQGPLHTVRVLLGAKSFVELINRYRYLSTIASYDRLLVQRVAKLELEFRGRNDRLRASLSDLEQLRRSELQESANLRNIESARQAALSTFRTNEVEALSRIERLDRDEASLTALVASLDSRRVDTAGRPAAPPPRAGATTTPPARPGTPATSPPRTSATPPVPSPLVGVGPLDWPVAGPILYRFGPERRPNGLNFIWKGLGIAAQRGAPVRAVRAGTVAHAGPFEGYGPTVVLDHGGGLFTLYLHLEEVGVVAGRRVELGQVVGTVGGMDTPEGPHIEFQIRVPSGTTNQPVDPLPLLKPPGR